MFIEEEQGAYGEAYAEDGHGHAEGDTALFEFTHDVCGDNEGIERRNETWRDEFPDGNNDPRSPILQHQNIVFHLTQSSSPPTPKGGEND